MDSPPLRRSAGRNGSTPTVLLVHDAFADTTMWAGAIAASRHIGADCVAVANPLRGLGTDAEYVAAWAATIDGPVVLVGHGYGGAVISVAAADALNVVGLAYVAGLIPDETESCVDLVRRWAGTGFLEALCPHTLATGTELTIDRESYPGLVAADLDPVRASASAACQRPVTAAALEERAARVGWRDLPVWALVATGDRLIGAEGQRTMGARAGATTFETEASHAVAVSRPDAVASLIAAATSAKSR